MLAGLPLAQFIWPGMRFSPTSDVCDSSESETASLTITTDYMLSNRDCREITSR